MVWEKMQSKIDREKQRIGSFGLDKVNQKVGRNVPLAYILAPKDNYPSIIMKTIL